MYDHYQVTLAEVESVPTAVKTSTYEPVPYGDLIQLVKDCTEEVLPGMRLIHEGYALSRNKKRMLGFLTLEGESTLKELPFLIALRSSHDKSLSVAIATGEKVMACGNGCLAGSDITYFRRHTKHVWADITQQIISALRGAEDRYAKNVINMENMKECKLSASEGFHFLGELIGKKVITSYQFSDALDQWREPKFLDFRERTMWSAYNAVTYGIGNRTDTKTVLKQHTELKKLALSFARKVAIA